MLKKIFFLLLSTRMLVAVSGSEIITAATSELTERQKVFVYAEATLGSLAIATYLGKQAVSHLPETTSCTVKAGVFIPVALVVLAAEACNFYTRDMLGFYKKHKWLFLGL